MFWTFEPKAIKIDPYNFQLYRFKVGAFFWDTVYTLHGIDTAFPARRFLNSISSAWRNDYRIRGLTGGSTRLLGPLCVVKWPLPWSAKWCWKLQQTLLLNLLLPIRMRTNDGRQFTNETALINGWTVHYRAEETSGRHWLYGVISWVPHLLPTVKADWSGGGKSLIFHHVFWFYVWF